MNMEKLNKQQKEAIKKEKKLELIAQMKYEVITTFDGKETLESLVFGVGVKLKKVYFCMEECKTSKKERQAQAKNTGKYSTTKVKKKIKSYGLVFNNGFEIKGVDSKFFKIIDCANKEEIKVQK